MKCLCKWLSNRLSSVVGWQVGSKVGFFCQLDSYFDSPVGCAIKLWPYHKMEILMTADLGILAILAFQHSSILFWSVAFQMKRH